jgi:hypothetical protein
MGESPHEARSCRYRSSILSFFIIHF